MVSFNDIAFYTTPEAPFSPSAEVMSSLNLSTGSHYLNCIFEYQGLCDFLGAIKPAQWPAAGTEIPIGDDGFAVKVSHEALGWPAICTFEESSLPMRERLFSLRARGHDYTHTYMGYLVDGRAVRNQARGVDERIKWM